MAKKHTKDAQSYQYLEKLKFEPYTVWFYTSNSAKILKYDNAK